MNTIKIISHADCNDGFGALYAAWKKFGDAPHIQYITRQYNDPLPTIESGDVVYIFDMSFEEETLLDWHQKTTSLILFDHHKSAQEKLAHLPFCHFDMEHSGACLAWKFLHPSTKMPNILSYVEDRDLWLWKLPHSKAIHAFLESRPRSFMTWDIENAWLSSENGFDLATTSGYAILDYKERLIESICNKAYEDNMLGHPIRVANTPVLQSEVAHKLLEMHPEIDFSAAFYRDNSKEYYSLRSENSRVDVSSVAATQGGGGHRNAAGFVRSI